MRLHGKINLGIVTVFVLLAATAGGVTFRWQTEHAIRAAENRVRLSIKAAWEIYNAKLERIQAALRVLADDPRLAAQLSVAEGAGARDVARRDLERVRIEQGMDVLTLVDRTGRVVLRTRPPYRVDDSLAEDPLVRKALRDGAAVAGTVTLDRARLDAEGAGMVEACERAGGEPRGMMTGAAVPVSVGGRVTGIVVMGNLLNGAVDKVDRIRNSVFENEQYQGRPVGTATIFMGDLRISTNVLDARGQRAVGTRASEEVSARVLRDGKSWTGRAWVVNAWYLSQYDPIRDPDERVIGMLYVGSLEQQYLDLRTMALNVQLSLVLGAMLLAMAVLYFTLRRTIVSPVERLSFATRMLAQGDLAYRVKVGSRDEIGDLSASFNQMAAQLRVDQEEIQSSRVELSKRNDELAATNRSYMEMLGFVSHELKAPLGAATLGLYSVRDGSLGSLNEAQGKVLASVGQNLDFLNEMVRRYLDLSRLEKGEVQVRKAWVRLRDEVVEPVLETLAAAIERRGLQVENGLAPGLRVYADRDLLRIVYDNLLSNAVKYGREDGYVRLGAELKAGMIELSVENAGEGIPRDQVGRLFKKFSRLALMEETGQRGTGLGLFICRAIVEQHGGTIGVDSEEGRWTRFAFTLPVEGSTNE